MVKSWNPPVRHIEDRHDYFYAGKARGMLDQNGFALVVDEVGRIRICQTSLNIKNPALECEYEYDSQTGRPVACKNIDVDRRKKRELGWTLLVDLYDDEDGDASRWEPVWQLYAGTPRRSPVPHLPDEWLPQVVLDRRKNAVKRDTMPSDRFANLGPAPKRKKTASGPTSPGTPGATS